MTYNPNDPIATILAGFDARIVAAETPAPIPAPIFTTQPTVSPASGTVGQVYTATAGIASNTTGYAGQWFLNGAAITGATALTYTSTVTGSLTYRSTAMGPGGSTPATSAAVMVVAVVGVPTIAFANPTASVTEGDTGTKTVSNTINATRNGVTGPLTINLTYGGTATSGVDYVAGPASLTLLDGVSSGSFDLTINGDTTVETDETIIIDAALSGYSATASKTITIGNDDIVVGAPTNTTAPVITGQPVEGGTLTLSNGSWTDNPSSFAKRWYANGTVIQGVTGDTYSPNSLVVGMTITGDVIASNAGGNSAPAMSAGVGPVTAAVGDPYGRSYEEALISPAPSTARSQYAYTGQTLLIGKSAGMVAEDTGTAFPDVLVKALGQLPADYPVDIMIYDSTDHSVDRGYIGVVAGRVNNSNPLGFDYLQYSEAVAAGWFDSITPKPTTGYLFRGGSTQQFETPCTVWDSDTGEWTMYYQTKSAVVSSGGAAYPNQATVMATSTNGLQWAPSNVAVLQVPRDVALADQHSGYFSAGRNILPEIPDKWVGYSLLGGTNKSIVGQWGASTGRGPWRLIAVTANQGGRVADETVNNYNIGSLFKPKNMRKTRQGISLLGQSSPPTSGATINNGFLYESLIDNKGLAVLRKPREVWRPQAGTFSNDRCGDAMAIDHVAAGKRSVVFAGATTSPSAADSLGILGPEIARNPGNSFYEPLTTLLPDPVGKVDIDFTALTGLPASVQAVTGGTAPYTVGPNGLEYNLPANAANILDLFATNGIIPANFTYIDLFVERVVSLTVGEAVGMRWGFSSTKDTTQATNSIYMGGGGTFSGTMSMAGRKAGASLTGYAMQRVPWIGPALSSSAANAGGRGWSYGVRWFPNQRRLIALTGGGEVEWEAFTFTDHPAINVPFFPYLHVAAAGTTYNVNHRVKRMMWRWG